MASFVAPQYFTDNRKNVITFPQHMLLVGKTNSGKSMLVADIFSNIDDVYRRSAKDNIIISISPNDSIEQNFLDRFNSKDDWRIIHFSMNMITEEGISDILSYIKKEGLLGKEIFLFIDDLAIQGYSSKHTNSFILKMLATFRHKNIALIITIQVGDKEFRPLMENSGYIIVMKYFGYHKCLEMILRSFMPSIKLPSLIRALGHYLEGQQLIGEHTVVNLSQAAMQNEVFFITNTIFNPGFGFTRSKIERACLML